MYNQGCIEEYGSPLLLDAGARHLRQMSLNISGELRILHSFFGARMEQMSFCLCLFNVSLLHFWQEGLHRHCVAKGSAPAASDASKR